jgi:demethylmenaquinone methyltransferase/2-methoxy-6-polyprenyl-1,4-benzoquinol methylase
MPVEDVHDLADEMREYYRARAPWHDEYMGYTTNAAMETLLHPIVSRVETLLTGLNVLEVACGTGNWTQVLAHRVHCVLATDINEEALSRAQAKEYPPGVVAFVAADAYALDGVGAGFTGAFAADWWSHVPRSLLGPFLDRLHGCLVARARVVFVEMLPRDHPDLRPYRHDREGNSICRRALPDGSAFDVVKNFPDREEVLESLAGRSEAAEYQAWPELGRWLVTYATPAPPPN